MVEKQVIKLGLGTLGAVVALLIAAAGTASASVPDNNSVTSAKIVDGAVTAADLGANSVGSSEIKTSAVGSSEIAFNAVNPSEIAPDAVRTSEIAADAVDSSEIAADAVNASEIATGAVGTGEIATGGVATADIAANAVNSTKLANAAADLGAANVTVNFGNTNGSFNTNITTDGTITATGGFVGNADTATALAANPADCAANTFATTIAATGALTCAAVGNAATTAASANTASAIVARDGSGNFSAGTITASLTGNSSGTHTGAVVGTNVSVSGIETLGKQAVTVADEGTGANATATLTPTSSYVEITCSDTQGCDITMGEGSATEGDQLAIVDIAGTSNFADTSGVSETTGSIALGQWDSLSFVYEGSRWVETGATNN